MASWCFLSPRSSRSTAISTTTSVPECHVGRFLPYQKSARMGNFSCPLIVQWLKSSAPGPRWRLCPHTPVIGSPRSGFRVVTTPLSCIATGVMLVVMMSCTEHERDDINGEARLAGRHGLRYKHLPTFWSRFQTLVLVDRGSYSQRGLVIMSAVFIHNCFHISVG